MRVWLLVTLSVLCLLVSNSKAQAGLPSPTAVNAKLKAAHLDIETATWDQLSKDLLYQSAYAMDATELEEHYPALPAEKLLLLQKFAHRPLAPALAPAMAKGAP